MRLEDIRRYRCQCVMWCPVGLATCRRGDRTGNQGLSPTSDISLSFDINPTFEYGNESSKPRGPEIPERVGALNSRQETSSRFELCLRRGRALFERVCFSAKRMEVKGSQRLDSTTMGLSSGATTPPAPEISPGVF
ncbi:hypothetical protein SKAU_G00143340 [Synaphobranchus kaupii]|uniref:Uncharacterized protein n=1 Tax=Synaphobranchus kaupii TaxID=118154 RepID=A0A9Q1FSV8_SYNKA|nr:hypothetical protein SKAU_G00143340 [Synaphobranchus kaupii]